MILLMTLIYVGCVLVAFRVVKIKVTAVSVAVSALIGVLLLGGIVSAWKLSAPMSQQMTLHRPVVRIVPNVREFVTKTHVESNQLVEKGQPLFEIARERFQNAVDMANADLAIADAQAAQAKAAIPGAEANLRKAVADEGSAKATVAVAQRMKRSSPGAVSKLNIAEAEADFAASKANTQVARSSLEESKVAYEAALRSVNAARAALANAEYELQQTTYRSAVDGRVVNFQVREHTPVARWQFTSVGTIMDMSDTAILAVYPQNLLKYVNAGDEVEMVFRRQPGVTTAGTVEAVVKYTGEGQFVASDTIPVAATVGSKGFLVVRIRLDDEQLARTLPLGADGTTAIYTEFGNPFHLISKIALRIKGWLYYLPV